MTLCGPVTSTWKVISFHSENWKLSIKHCKDAEVPFALDSETVRILERLAFFTFREHEIASSVPLGLKKTIHWMHSVVMLSGSRAQTTVYSVVPSKLSAHVLSSVLKTIFVPTSFLFVFEKCPSIAFCIFLEIKCSS